MLQQAKMLAYDMFDPNLSDVALERELMAAKQAVLDMRPRTRRKC
jgi:hypothetical protein